MVKPWIIGKHYTVDASSGCWTWLGTLDKHGYGKTTNNEFVHRRAYRLANGPIPEGLCVCHTCDNPRCVNPEHLWLGSLADNNRDMMEKRRQNLLGNAVLNR